MRSDLVQRAAVPLSNRFFLVHVTAQLVRKFHRPMKDCLPATINQSLKKIGDDSYLFSFTPEGSCKVNLLPPVPRISEWIMPAAEERKPVASETLDCGTLSETA